MEIDAVTFVMEIFWNVTQNGFIFKQSLKILYHYDQLALNDASIPQDSALASIAHFSKHKQKKNEKQWRLIKQNFVSVNISPN